MQVSHAPFVRAKDVCTSLRVGYDVVIGANGFRMRRGPFGFDNDKPSSTATAAPREDAVRPVLTRTGKHALQTDEFER